MGGLLDSESIPLKIFFIGPRGAGKSATINTIIGENVARSKPDLSSESTTQDITEYPVKNLSITLVDTPALKGPVIKKLSRALAGSDVIGFVIPAQRMQEEDVSCIRIFLKDFKDFAPKSFIIITRGKNYHAEDVFNWEDIKELYNLFIAVGQRFVVFENKFQTQEERKYQIERFLSVVNKCKAKRTARLPSSVDKAGRVSIPPHVVFPCIGESGKVIFETSIKAICNDILEDVLQELFSLITPSVFEIDYHISLPWIYFPWINFQQSFSNNIVNFCDNFWTPIQSYQ